MNCRLYMILEVKFEVGFKGAEPYCQAILYYARANADKVEKAFMQDVQFNFRCLIITLFGWFCCKSASPPPHPLMKHCRPSPRFLWRNLG